MKPSSLLLLAALVAACGAVSSPEVTGAPPAPGPGVVVVAEFDGEVDLVAGTFTLRTVPAPAGSAGGVPALVIDDKVDVTVANVGTPWNNATGHACDPIAVTGAAVQVSLGPAAVSAGITLGGVWAEITQFYGPNGTESCKNVLQPGDASPPAGFDGRYGLWHYGTLTPTTPAGTVEWDFPWMSAAKFTFHGRILATRIETASASASASTPVQPGPFEYSVAWNGAHVVVADPYQPTLYLLGLDGAQAGTVPLPDVPMAITADAATGRTWFTTTPTNTTSFWVGAVESGGTVRQVDVAGLAGVTTPYVIVVDPANANVAWFADRDAGFVASVTLTPATGVLTIGTPIPLPPIAGSSPPVSESANGLAFGSDGKLHVTSSYGGPSSAGLVFRLDNPGTGTWSTLDPTAACQVPMAMIRGPDGNLWFTSDFGDGSTTTGAICTLTTAGAFHSVAAVPSPRGLAVGADGKVWYTDAFNGVVGRIDPATATAPPYRFEVADPPVDPALSPPALLWLTATPATAVHPAYIWVNADASVLRLTP